MAYFAILNFEILLVLGWGGQKSVLSRSMEDDGKRSSERTLDEEYDAEFDQGRVGRKCNACLINKEAKSQFRIDII